MSAAFRFYTLLILMGWRSIAAAANELPSAQAAEVFYVSVSGNDDWTGRIPQAGKQDGPFATIDRARLAVRKLRESSAEPRTVRVVVQAGTYYLNQPITFGPDDSGVANAPTVYEAEDGEVAVLSGGRRLSAGRLGSFNDHPAWIIDVPEVRAGKWRFRQLFVNGRRRPRSRLPKQGEFQIESLPGYTGDFLRSPTKQFVYGAGDLDSSWKNLKDVDVIGVTKWIDNRLPIESIESGSRTVTFDRSSLFALLSNDSPGKYRVENVREAVAPGEWYLDRPSGLLYILPEDGEDLSVAEIIAPRLERVIEVVGDAEHPVHDLQIRGLTCSHTEWQPPADFASSLQAGIEVPGSVRLEHAVDCAFVDGAIEHIGNYAVEVGVGCRDIEIARNRLTDLGGGGVRVGHFFSWETDGNGQLTDRGRRRKEAMPSGARSRGILVADNEISHCGRVTAGAVGIFIGDNPDNQVVRNHIFDLFYSGISVGSIQDFGDSQARNNRVESNHIHQIGQGMLSDLAGIYTCSCPGTSVRLNRVHDVVRRDYGGWGIYLDEGSHDVNVDQNVVYDCQDGALFVHHARDIVVENNILALCGSAQIERGGIGGFELTFRKNVVYFSSGRALGSYGDGNTGREVCRFDHNLYWNASGEPLLFGSKNLDQWHALGQDIESLVADPQFADPGKADFKLSPDSPAARIGFENWDQSTVGPRRTKDASP